jgi:hypothetical protein
MHFFSFVYKIDHATTGFHFRRRASFFRLPSFHSRRPLHDTAVEKIKTKPALKHCQHIFWKALREEVRVIGKDLGTGLASRLQRVYRHVNEGYWGFIYKHMK